MKLKIDERGGSVGVILPREILKRLRVKQGDELYALETPNGIVLTSNDPGIDEQMAVAEEVLREDGGLLKKMADR